MNSQIPNRLRSARIAAGFETAQKAAEALGENPQNVRDHEAGRRKVKPEMAERYARLYKVSAAHLLFGDGGGSTSGMHIPDDVRMVGIVGEVRANMFSKVEDGRGPSEYVPVRLPEYERTHLFALNVVGRSMDLFYPDGSVVVVCPTHEAGLRLNDHVVVRRWRGELVETTLKEIVEEGGKFLLRPRSSDPAYQEPLQMTRARDNERGIEILGVVVGSFSARGSRNGPLLPLP